LVRLAIISDTHLPRGSRVIPTACLERMKNADAILHAGDITQLSILRELEALGPPVHAVYGNIDEPAVRTVLPAARVVEAEGVRIAMTHDGGPAEGRLERLRGRFPGTDAAVFGHSHLPLHEQRGSFQIFNPGSPTDRRRAPRHTMGLATVDAGRVRFELIPLD
jgi:putative phosphoesterase